MSLFKFHEDDIFINTIEAYPEYKFYVQSGNVYINDLPHLSGANTDNITGVPKGFVSLYEYNIDRSSNYIYPFIEKNSSRDIFKKISSIDYNTQFLFGDVITSSYNMSASISRDYYSTSTRSRIKALKNVFKYYSYLSPHYQYSSSLGNKETQKINLISIPSILYGSRIKKGSVCLKFYLSGSLIGELSDKNLNGELVQIGPTGSTGSGSVAGVVLYREGFIVLTGSWNLDSKTIAYDSSDKSKWIYYNYGANDGNTMASSAVSTLSASFLTQYQGVNKIQTLTMLTHAKYGELNYSNNPTFISSSDFHNQSKGKFQYIEVPRKIKNIVHSDFADEIPKFEKVTYISKVAIYDEDKNLIGIAKVSTPVRKTEKHQYTFKLKLDI